MDELSFEPAEDLGPGYAAYRQDAEDSRLDAGARARAGLPGRVLLASNEHPPPAPPMPQPAPADRRAGQPEPAAVPQDTRSDIDTSAAETRPDIGMAEHGGRMVGDLLMGRPGALEQIRRDMRLGLREAPEQIVGGVRDAVQESWETIDDAAEWLDVHVSGNAPPPPGERPSEVLKLGEVSQPESFAGALIRGTTKFLASFAGASKLARGAIKEVPPKLRGAIEQFRQSKIGRIIGLEATIASSVAVTQDSTPNPLSDLFAGFVAEHPALGDRIAEYLAADPTDSAVEGRFKHALETAGLHETLDALIVTFKGVRAVLRVVQGPGPQQTALDGAASQPDVADQVDPDPLVPIVTVEPPATEAASATATVSSRAAAERRLVATDEARYTEAGPNGFLRLADGSTAFGMIDEGTAKAAGIDPGPIRLRAGMHNPETDSGFGEVHIAARHSKQIRQIADPTGKPYEDIGQFVADVASTFNQIRLDPNGKLFLIVRDPAMAGRSQTQSGLIVGLQAADDGVGYEVFTAGPFRNRYLENRPIIWEGARITPPQPTGQVVPSVPTPSQRSGAAGPSNAGGQTTGHIGVRDGEINIWESARNTPSQPTGQVAPSSSLPSQRSGVAGSLNARGQTTEHSPLRSLPWKPAEQPASRGPSAPGAQGIDADIVPPSDKSNVPQPGAKPETKPSDASLALPALRFNFARIDGAADVARALDEAAEAVAPQIAEGARGVPSEAASRELADVLGIAPEALLVRRGALAPEEALAGQAMWAASATTLAETARRAAAPAAGAAEQYGFRKMLALTQALRTELASRTTGGEERAQADFALPSGSGVETARNMARLVEDMGVVEVSRALAQRLTRLAELGTPPQALAAAARRGVGAASMDAVEESYVAGLLWQPTEHVARSGASTAAAFMQLYEHMAGRGIGRLRGADSDGVAEGEALALSYGLLRAIPEAFRLGWTALRAGEPGAPAPRRGGTLGAEAADIADTGLGRAVELIGHAARLPTRLLAAEDALLKTVGHRMALHAQALRQAVQEGASEPARRMAELTADPPAHLRLAAVDAASYQSFAAAPGHVLQALRAGRDAGELNPAFLALPFLDAPGNLLRYGFERTPLAPLVAHWRADVAAGGARADIALARMATGSAVLAWALDMAHGGAIAADAEGGEIQIGGRRFGYRQSAHAPLFDFAAGLAAAARHADAQADDLDDWQAATAAAAVALGRQVLDRRQFRRLAGLIAAMEAPHESAPGAVERLLAEPARGVAEHWPAALAMLPDLAALPPKRDLWGARRAGSAPAPIDAAMAALDLAPAPIRPRTAFKGVAIDLRRHPEVYDAYVRLAGNELPHPAWGLGARDLLDRVVSGAHALAPAYDRASTGRDGGKAAFITRTIQEYRRLAAEKVLREPRFAQFRAEWTERAIEAREPPAA